MWSPEEEYIASQFLNSIVRGEKIYPHTENQLDFVETQIGKVQAGLTGGDHLQTYGYVKKTRNFGTAGGFIDESKRFPCDTQFLHGMTTIATYLRRNIQR